MSRRISVVILFLVFGALWIPKDLLGQEYPTREIEYIAAYGPGSIVDSSARLVSKFGEKYVGKPIVVVSKPGGGGVRGFTALATAKPDGYTIGGIANTVIGHPYLVKGVTYQYKKSFRPIARTVYDSCALFVKKGGPYDIALKDIVKKAKENPNTMKLGIGGTWTLQDYVRAIFEDQAGVKFIRVPFTQIGDVIPALLGGHIDVELGSEWAPLYKAGRLNVLASSAEKRDPRFPEIPTFRELGFEVVLLTNHWVAAPTGTPDHIINFLADAFKKAFTEPAFKEAADNLGVTAAWQGPEESMKTMEEVDQLYQGVIKKLGLKPE